MTAAEAIRQLRGMGFLVALIDEEHIFCEYRGGGEDPPDPEAALRLLGVLKARKPEALEVLRHENTLRGALGTEVDTPEEPATCLQVYVHVGRVDVQRVGTICTPNPLPPRGKAGRML